MERVLPELGDVLVGSARRKRPEEGGQPRARPIATEFPEGPPPRLENLGEVGLELGRRRKGVRPVGGPVGAVPVAMGPEARVRELRLDAEEVGDVGGDLAVLVHDNVLEDHRHGRLAEEEIPGGTGDGMEHPNEGRAFVRHASRERIRAGETLARRTPRDEEVTYRGMFREDVP